jgi:N-acetyl sugar amidotransferase
MEKTETQTLEVKYGLPAEVKYCKRCVMSNQRPCSEIEFTHHAGTKKKTIHFDAEGICDACRFVESKKKSIDWSMRDKELRDLCDRFRSKTGAYDCVVPGSGGKDSFYAAHQLKYNYGMHPLTVTWAPNMYTDWGWKNFQAWIHAGFDNYLCTPSGRTHRLLTRLAVENLFHAFQPFILGQKNVAPKIASKFNIPLVFYGENEAEYGNPLSDGSSAKRSWDFFTKSDAKDVYLGGVPLDDLKGRWGFNDNDLSLYLPQDPSEIMEKKIEVHYLGYYLKWHPQSAYYYAVEHGGFQASPERTPGTYAKYNSIDDKIDDLFYYSTYIKFGVGRSLYDASQEVRSGDITREEAVALVKRFDGELPERFLDDIFKYLSIGPKEFPEQSKHLKHPVMDRAYFTELTDSFRSEHIWKKESGQWKLRHPLWETLA